MDARDAYEEVRAELEDLLTYVSHYPPVDIPEVFEQLSEHFAALGICKLLVTGDPDDFRFGLTQSGYARKVFLERIGPDKGQLHLGLSRTDAIFDALAAGAISLARDIATLSTDRWLSTRDYEEDFLYRRILGTLSIGGPEVALKCAEMADHMEEIQGGTSPRVDLCRALAKGEADSFVEALQDIAAAYYEKIEDRRQVVEEGDYLFWPRSHVNVEALALLRLAELQGMVVDAHIPLCPPEACVKMVQISSINLVEEATRLGTAG